jgi:hypothetical protein
MSGSCAEPDLAGFNYTTLDPVLAAQARGVADGIHRRFRSCIAETGRDLITIKEKMPHGLFGGWIRAEFRISDRTAQNYMNFAEFIEGKSEKFAHLPATIIYELASPSAPRAIVEEIIADVDSGVVMSLKAVRTKLANPTGAKNQPKQVADEFAPEEPEATRSDRRAAQRLAAKANRDREEQQRIAKVPPLVRRIGSAMAPQDLANVGRSPQGK